MTMRKLARSQMSSYKLRLIKAQGGVCPISLREYDPKDSKNWVIDHDHGTGEIRGALYRSANGAEGKVAHAVARWGGVGSEYSEIIPYLERMIAYLKKPGTGMIYPMHKTEDEKRLARNLKARQARATRTARTRLKED